MPIHFASAFHIAGGASAVCYQRLQRINLNRATWTNRPEAVTCPKCLRLLRDFDMSAEQPGERTPGPVDFVDAPEPMECPACGHVYEWSEATWRPLSEHVDELCCPACGSSVQLLDGTPEWEPSPEDYDLLTALLL